MAQASNHSSDIGVSPQVGEHLCIDIDADELLIKSAPEAAMAEAERTPGE